MRLQSIKKKSAFVRLVFNPHAPLENTETPTSPRLQRGLTNMRLQRIKKNPLSCAWFLPHTAH